MSLNIELGGGEHPAKIVHKNMQDYINIDGRPLPTVDVVLDVSENPLPYENNSVDHIYNCHFMEHISYAKTLNKVLPECLRVLKPGKSMSTFMPILDGIMDAWFKQCRCKSGSIQYSLKEPCKECGGLATYRSIMEYLYGGQHNPFDFHRYVWSIEEFTKVLLKTGFKEVKTEIPEFPMAIMIIGIK